MAITETSKTRLASINETTIGTIPSTPTWQVMRFLSADLRPQKQTEVPDEIRSDGNVASIVDVGRSITGSVSANLSYGTYDDWLTWAMNAAWSTNVLTNGTTPKTGAMEFTYTDTGGTANYLRFAGMRVNTLDLGIETKKSVTADFGFMGLTPTTASAIVTGATYTAATTTEVFNGGLNVASMSVSGISNSPKAQKINLRINNNLQQVDVVGQYTAYGHVLGRFEVTGTIDCLFENMDTYNAILNHTTVGIAFTLTDAASKSYAFSIPKAKLLDGGPTVGGNGQAVVISVPFQAIYDSGIGGSLRITRTP